MVQLTGEVVIDLGDFGTGLRRSHSENRLRIPYQNDRQIDAHRSCVMILGPWSPAQLPSIGDLDSIDHRITEYTENYYGPSPPVRHELNGEQDACHLTRGKTR